MSVGLGRLWRTVRWLRAGQVFARMRFAVVHPQADNRAPPAVRAAARDWIHPPEREASLVGPTRWRFLSEEHDLEDIGWDAPDVALLWRYNQHYFDDLNAKGAAARCEWHRALLNRWRDENPPGRVTAWAPYPTSLRIVNWVKWFVGGQSPDPAWMQSLATQARWLARRIEWHLLGNHLFANAKALVFAGLWFQGTEAEQWLTAGLAILERELPEQILADGGQFERSPMYHALALEDVLDLINLIQSRSVSDTTANRLLPVLRRNAGTMLRWLRCMLHPGGTLARFNDSADGIGPAPIAIETYAAALGVTAEAAPSQGVTLLEPSGYVRMARADTIALLDTAPIGPDYLPGHAHADTLSFELALGGRELIVNRGTSVYGTGERRQIERGTSAHSTVQIGCHDSSEVWAGFRVGRRARVTRQTIDGWSVEASHDGYVHLRGCPIHRRRWSLEEDGMLVDDTVDPASIEEAVVRFHLAPGLGLQVDGSCWRVEDCTGAVLASISIEAGGTGSREQWLHAERFGLLVAAETLVVPLEANRRARVRWRW
ncbi:MAG: alginate lyase family protein [Burkholderiaceae bacterium]|nr:alginate lyase family protein [Burkholderiaceae bacterium]